MINHHIFLIFAILIIARIFSFDMLVKASSKSTRAKTLVPALQSIIDIGLVLVGVTMILSELGVSTAPIFAAGFALVVTSQQLIGDVFAGVMALADGSYMIGDVVETQGKRGTVIKINLVRTTILSDDNVVWHVRNSEMARMWGKI
jgi:small-conductance mechanosensitive channel